MRHRYQLMLGASLACLAFSSPVLAEDLASDQVDELVVTAQKREQRTLDVPIALTAYGEGRLEDLGIQEFEELSLFVPGFEVQNQSPNNPGFVMRGITSDSGEATNEPRVSVFQDGVSISKSRGSYVELFDLERVEIAKGPQSTLFGRGALIGAVNIVQAKADPGRFAASSQVEAGNHGYAMFETAVNMPVGETFAIRAAARLKARKGYVENLLGGEDYNSTDTQAYRIALALRPSEAVRADLIVNYQTDSPSGTSFKSLTFLPSDPQTGRALGDLGANSGAALGAADGFLGGRQLGLEREVWGGTALVSWAINETLSLSSITAWRAFDSLETFDADGFSLPLFVFAEDAWGRQTSQELRLNYEGGPRFSGFIGAGYFKEKGVQAIPLQLNEKVYALVAQGLLPRPAGLSLPQVNALTPAPLKSAHRETYANLGETEALDIFADATFRPVANLELTAGVRYTSEDKTSGYRAQLDNGGSVLGGSTALVARGAVIQPTAGGAFQYAGLSDSGLTWRLVARYSPSEDLSAYVSYARGRRPKVLSVGSPSTPGGSVRFSELPAEVVDSVEIGAKAALLERSLLIEGSVYRYDYENFQTSIVNSAGQIVSANAGEASATGFESQLTWRPRTGLEAFATYAYSHARFGNGLFKDNSFRLSPDHSASVGLKVSLPLLAGQLVVTPAYTWQSRIFFDANNDLPRLQAADKVQDEFQGAYGLLNLRISYTRPGANWRLEAFASNLLDEDYIKDAGNTGDAFGIATFIAGEPRYVGIGAAMSF